MLHVVYDIGIYVVEAGMRFPSYSFLMSESLSLDLFVKRIEYKFIEFVWSYSFILEVEE